MDAKDEWLLLHRLGDYLDDALKTLEALEYKGSQPQHMARELKDMQYFVSECLDDFEDDDEEEESPSP